MVALRWKSPFNSALAAASFALFAAVAAPSALAFQSLGAPMPPALSDSLCDRSVGEWVDTQTGGEAHPDFDGREAAVVRVALQLDAYGAVNDVVFAYPDVVSWFDDAVKQAFIGRRFAPSAKCKPPRGAGGEVKAVWTYFMPVSPLPGHERLQAVVDFWLEPGGDIGAVEINTARGDFDAKSLATAPLREVVIDLVKRDGIKDPGVYRARIGVAGWTQMTGDWAKDRRRLRPIYALEGQIVDFTSDEVDFAQRD